MKQLNESDQIELRSEEVQEILTRPPHALIRWGISVICGVIVLLFIGCFLFKYPDIVTGQVTITTEKPPVWLVTKTSGRIKELYCVDKQPVRQGEVLAVIDNTAVTTDIQEVDSLLQEAIITDSLLYTPFSLFSKAYELGDLQTAFSSFTKAAIQFDNFLSINLTSQEKEALQKQISGKRMYSKTLEEQLKLKEHELAIGRTVYERDKELYDAGVIAKAELEASEQTFLNLQQSLHQMRSSLINESVQSVQLSESVKKLSLQYLQEKNQYVTNLRTAYRELLASIEQWKQTYLLASPIDGVVTFITYWQEDQFVEAGKRVFAVVPQKSGDLIGKTTIPSSGIGKIKEGQTVNIKVNGYPYMEYGILKSTIHTISLVPDEEDNYSIEVRLPNGLKTSTGNKLLFKGELSGIAEIITEDRSIGQRLISPLLYFWKERVK